MAKRLSVLLVLTATCCRVAIGGEPPFRPGDPKVETPVGILGYRIGTYLTIEGVRAEEGKVGLSTLVVDKIGDYKLQEPVSIWIENLELPPGQRCVLKGYESGSWIGVPEDVLRATGGPGPQAMWQLHFHFVVTSVEQPKGRKVIASGDWSEPVGYEDQNIARPGCAIRGRLVICEGYSPGYEGTVPETLVYLELQNVTPGGGNPIRVYCDFENGLQCKLRDAHGQPPAPTGGGGDGGFPSPCWITLPYDATIRLRASWFGHGTPEGAGLRIPLFHELAIPAGDTNEYFLSGTFRSQPPANRAEAPSGEVWKGTLKLPPMRMAVKKP